MAERLQKIIAHAGIASRRAAEEMILAGKVKVNGKVVRELGTKVNGKKDLIEVSGQKIIGKERLTYILLYKPKGYLSTVHDPQKRPTVMDLIPEVASRVYPVGRLDYDSSGLLLLTNDGGLAHNLIHPSKEVPKTYRTLVQGIPSAQALGDLAHGIILAEGKTAPAQVSIKKIIKHNAVIDISIHEGKKRQVRRMFGQIGHPVIWLKRISFGPLKIGRMQPGQWRYLTKQEVVALKKYSI